MKKTKITLLIPAMLDDHFDLLKYAFDSEYVHTVLLKNHSNITNTGLEYAHNDLCYPGVLIIGQIINALRNERFRRDDNCVIMVAQAGDACRGSNYIPLIRKALKKAAIDVPVISLNFLDMEGGARFGITPSMLMKALAAIMYGDELMLLRNQTAPYEKNKGDTDRLYKQWLRRLGAELKLGIGLNPLSMSLNFKRISDSFADIERCKHRLPKIGVVGELYIKYCSLGNHDTGRYLESCGAEHMVNGFSWYVLYYIDTHLTEDGAVGAVMKAAYSAAKRTIETVQKSMIKAVRANGFASFDSFSGFKKRAEKYIPCTCPTGDGWLIGAELCNYAELGFEKAACVQPFGCMPNHICGRGLYSSIQRRIRERGKKFTLVSVDYDPGIADVNIRNRLQLLFCNFPDRKQ